METVTSIEMRIPDWVRQVLSDFEKRTAPHNEVQIADALDILRKGQGDLSDEDWKGYLAERSAFSFLERASEDSVWDTYFAPMATATRDDGTELRVPDIQDLDSADVAHWEKRATSVKNPIMRARYADLVWDLERVITKGRRQYQYAQIAVDAYIEATEKQLYTMDIEGFVWLRRALGLSLCIEDKVRQKRVVDSIFALYDKVLDPRHIGVWVFPFDCLYDNKVSLTPEHEARLITDLETMLLRTSGKAAAEEFDPFGAQAAAERLARHYNRQNDRSNVQRVVKAYGQAFEKISRDASPMLAMAWLQPVVERYEQEGLREEAEQLQVLSAEKGKNVGDDLKNFSVKSEVKRQDVDSLVEHLIGSGDLETSLCRVADYFIPKADDARRFLEKMRTETPLLSMIPIVVVESDGRPTAKIDSLDEDAEGRLHAQLAQSIGFYQPFLAHTLEKLRETYNETADDILDVLYKSPLFIESRRELLQEGLIAYQQGDYVKAIHVLVPQVEQTLRNLLALLRIPTEKTVKRHPGIMDVKNMNDVLGDERAKQSLTENLWRYLAVVYVDRRGLNLRNNLAHGLVGPRTFCGPTADLVFHSLLALSLMRPPEKTQTTDQE